MAYMKIPNSPYLNVFFRNTPALAAALLLAVCLPPATSRAQQPGPAPQAPPARQAAPAPANTAGGYAAVWYDDTAQGAVQISPCGQRLCGRIVWLKTPLNPDGSPLIDANNPEARHRKRPICGLDVIGDVKRQPDGTWDAGWIYDPKEGKSYDVELNLKSQSTLNVIGYLGMKFLSQTLVWKRAPADLGRCVVMQPGQNSSRTQ